MFDFKTFMTKVKVGNSHYERIRRSSLHDLVALVQQKPFAKPDVVLAELDKVPAAKKDVTYKEAIKYLKANYPGLNQLIMQKQMNVGIATGPSSVGYAPGKWERRKDAENHWHEFLLQAKGNSCGPTCVRIIKTYLYPAAKMQLSEEQIRGVVAQFEAGTTNQGVSSIATQTVGLHDFENNGIIIRPLVQALKAQPFAVPRAKEVYGSAASVLAQLNEASPKAPAIVGWWWGTYGTNNLGGHWTICVGPTKDGRLIILDPWNGVQYLENTATGFNRYQVVENGSITAEGWFNPNNPNDVAVITTR